MEGRFTSVNIAKSNKNVEQIITATGAVKVPANQPANKDPIGPLPKKTRM